MRGGKRRLNLSLKLSTATFEREINYAGDKFLSSFFFFLLINFPQIIDFHNFFFSSHRIFSSFGLLFSLNKLSIGWSRCLGSYSVRFEGKIMEESSG
jgi:hypothetical protein